MGEVYRARDPRLNRDVAIKTLPAGFAGDPERVARFEREAKLLAALNHPNIAMIFGIEDRALVMELVEGVTLAERISTGPIPLDEVMGIARQIAEALEAAHAKGIVHRDLKPPNVKITPQGGVKVLDFGLAKLEQSTASPGDDTQTMECRLTEVGMVVGTAAYMSPEQARAAYVDARTDLFSFGAMLYEMATGRRAF